jgi:hypothetical protein
VIVGGDYGHPREVGTPIPGCKNTATGVTDHSHETPRPFRASMHPSLGIFHFHHIPGILLHTFLLEPFGHVVLS